MSPFQQPPGPAVSATTDFRNFYPRAEFDRLADHRLSQRGDVYPPGWRETFRDLRDDGVGGALREFLTALRDEGLLHPLAGGAGRQIRILKDWNDMLERNFADADREYMAWRDIVEKFILPLVHNAFREVDLAIAQEAELAPALDAAYEAIVAQANSGDFRWWMGGFREEYDFATDDRFLLDVRGWRPMLGSSAVGDDLIPISDVDRPDIVHGEVAFETGELLVADWFRIDEFTDAVDDRGAARGGPAAPSINSAAGREASTLRCLKEFGFVSVHLGNTSPRVYAVDGVLAAGWVDEYRYGPEGEFPMPGGVREVASVSTCLWNATIIDRARLVAIIAGRTGIERAEQLVADYVGAQDVHTIKVEPGVHHLYFSGDYEEFAGRFGTPDAEIPDAVEMVFVLSPRPLALRPGRPTPEPPPPAPGVG